MFEPCKKCNGWGIAKDEIGFSMVKCPDCDNGFIDENREKEDEIDIESENKTMLGDFDY